MQATAHRLPIHLRWRAIPSHVDHCLCLCNMFRSQLIRNIRERYYETQCFSLNVEDMRRIRLWSNASDWDRIIALKYKFLVINVVNCPRPWCELLLGAGYDRNELRGGKGVRRSSAAPPDTGLMFYALEADVYDALTCRSITELFFWYSRVHLIRHHHCRQGGGDRLCRLFYERSR